MAELFTDFQDFQEKSLKCFHKCAGGCIIIADTKANKINPGMPPKYEQSVNMPKNFRKTAVIRIFRQIPAKSRLESQCLCGFPDGAVEMEEARLGR